MLLFFKLYSGAFCAHAIFHHFYVCNHLCFSPPHPPPGTNHSLTVQFSIYFIVLFRVISLHTAYLCPNPECLIPLGFFSSIHSVIWLIYAVKPVWAEHTHNGKFQQKQSMRSTILQNWKKGCSRWATSASLLYSQAGIDSWSLRPFLAIWLWRAEEADCCHVHSLPASTRPIALMTHSIRCCSMRKNHACFLCFSSAISATSLNFVTCLLCGKKFFSSALIYHFYCAIWKGCGRWAHTQSPVFPLYYHLKWYNSWAAQLLCPCIVNTNHFSAKEVSISLEANIFAYQS